MSTYLMGNLFGRLTVSYALVWSALWLLARCDWRVAFRRTNHWSGLTATTTIFLIGLIVAQANGGAR